MKQNLQLQLPSCYYRNKGKSNIIELKEEKALGINSVQDWHYLTVGPLTGRYDEATAYQRLIFCWRR